MSKTQLFIEKARAVHGDRYNYPKTVYVRSKEKLIIACKEHGDFEQRPNAHLSGHGCAACSFELLSKGRMAASAKVFITKARAKHGNRYDYSKVIYVGAREKVIIICAEHGDFEQMANSHLNGSGCARCSGRYTHTAATFKAKAESVHDGRYTYVKSEYRGNRVPVTITCIIHGDFEQKPMDHLAGNGCFECGRITRSVKLVDSVETFIEKAKLVHGDKYDYSKVVYVNSNVKVLIICPTHGMFSKAPSKHIVGQGCPRCPNRYDEPSNLYIMTNGLDQVKIGFSMDINRRLENVNRNQPFTAEVLRTWTLRDTPAAREAEQQIHRELAGFNAGLTGFDGATEWFNTTPEYATMVIERILTPTTTNRDAPIC